MTSRTLARRIAKSMLSKKAKDVQILDLRGLSNAADFFVLGTADSDVQVRAIADIVEVDAAEDGQFPWHTEGRRAGRWVIQDFVDVVAHVFHKEARAFYSLERLWGDAKVTSVRDSPPRTVPARKKKTPSPRRQSA